MVSNIIQFPQRVKQNDESEEEFAEEYAKLILSTLFENLHRMGLEPKDKSEEMLPVSFLVVESVKAFYLKSHNIYHPLQDVAEEFFYEPEE